MLRVRLFGVLITVRKFSRAPVRCLVFLYVSFFSNRIVDTRETGINGPVYICVKHPFLMPKKAGISDPGYINLSELWCGCGLIYSCFGLQL